MNIPPKYEDVVVQLEAERARVTDYIAQRAQTELRLEAALVRESEQSDLRQLATETLGQFADENQKLHADLAALREELDRTKKAYEAYGIDFDRSEERAAALQQRLTVAEQRNSALEAALKFYADGDHLLLADADAWDTCSGEPVNFLHDDAGTASVEDGSIAKAELNPAEEGEGS